MKHWKWLRVLVVAMVLYVIVLLGNTSEGVDPDKARARVDMRAVREAVERFKAEYQRLPSEGAHASGAEFSNAALVRILTGVAKEQNPNGTQFLQVRAGEKRWGRWRRGIDPASGALLDPWGYPYHFVLNQSEGIRNPYHDFGPQQLKQDVIVWSLGGCLSNVTDRNAMSIR